MLDYVGQIASQNRQIAGNSDTKIHRRVPVIHNHARADLPNSSIFILS